MPSSEQTLEKAVAKLKGEAAALIAKLDIQVEVHAQPQPDGLYLNFKGPDQNRLRDHRGEIVKAMAVVFQAYWDRHYPDLAQEIRCDVDSEGQQQEAELKKRAFDAAESLKNTGDQVDIGPFNSYERRIIHLALKELPQISTQSLGEGHQKMMRLKLSEAPDS